MALNELAQDAGFKVNAVGEIVVPAPRCDARPMLEKLMELAVAKAMLSICEDDCSEDDWDRGYNAGVRQAASQRVSREESTLVGHLLFQAWIVVSLVLGVWLICTEITNPHRSTT